MTLGGWEFHERIWVFLPLSFLLPSSFFALPFVFLSYSLPLFFLSFPQFFLSCSSLFSVPLVRSSLPFLFLIQICSSIFISTELRRHSDTAPNNKKRLVFSARPRQGILTVPHLLYVCQYVVYFNINIVWYYLYIYIYIDLYHCIHLNSAYVYIYMCVCWFWIYIWNICMYMNGLGLARYFSLGNWMKLVVFPKFDVYQTNVKQCKTEHSWNIDSRRMQTRWSWRERRRTKKHPLYRCPRNVQSEVSFGYTNRWWQVCWFSMC